MSTALASPPFSEVVHGVHDALAAAVEAPISHYAVATSWVEGVTSRVQVRGHRLTVSQPAPLAADDGPSPVELILGALGTCQEIVLSVHAQLLGITLDTIRVDVAGDLDPRGFFGAAEVPVGFSEVRYTVHLDSPADPARIAELIGRADRLCPVTAIIAEPTPITGSYVVNGVPHQAGGPASS